MELYAGLDLHSRNTYIGLLDQNLKRVFKKRVVNNLEIILQTLNPFRDQLKGLVVESTFNWYWLVDGLIEAGFSVHLVNTAAVKQYEGLKYTDDTHDAFWLAHLMRLGILPTGYIYPKAQRAVRDLLRKRAKLVRQRTAHVLSAKSLYTRLTGRDPSTHVIKRYTAERIYLPTLDDANRRLELQCSLRLIQTLNQHIAEIEKTARKQVELAPAYAGLKGVPGIGEILALTIMLETGELSRFASAGQYASYCRCVKSTKLSNGKKKGEGNTKNGNKYLAWAYVEAAHFAVQHHRLAKRFYQRKQAQRNSIVATKATAHKLARACYYVMRDGVAFKPGRLFR